MSNIEISLEIDIVYSYGYMCVYIKRNCLGIFFLSLKIKLKKNRSNDFYVPKKGNIFDDYSHLPSQK